MFSYCLKEVQGGTLVFGERRTIACACMWFACEVSDGGTTHRFFFLKSGDDILGTGKVYQAFVL